MPLASRTGSGWPLDGKINIDMPPRPGVRQGEQHPDRPELQSLKLVDEKLRMLTETGEGTMIATQVETRSPGPFWSANMSVRVFVSIPATIRGLSTPRFRVYCFAHRLVTNEPVTDQRLSGTGGLQQMKSVGTGANFNASPLPGCVTMTTLPKAS